jgi:sugar lactone lactonase YvrE
LTLTPAPPRPFDQDRIGALIREARRLQRRRRRRTAIVVGVVAVAAGVLTWAHGGAHGAAHHRSAARSVRPARTADRRRLGLATAYQLTGPTSVAVDKIGNLYLTDGSRVLEVEPATRQLLVVAGTGKIGFAGDGHPALEARLSYPRSVAVARNGDVYFADSDRIRMVAAATGIISTVAGNGRAGSSGNGGPAVRASLNLDGAGDGSVLFNQPLAIAPNGDLYIADSANDEIRKVDHGTGIITRVADDGRSGDRGVATRAASCAPLGLALKGSSNLFVSTVCGAIREVSTRTGLISTIFSVRQSRRPALEGLGSAHDPVGIAVYGRHLYAAEAYGRRLLEIDPRTRVVTRVAGTGDQTIQRPHGNAGDGGPASEATFGLALDVAVDDRGDIFVADFFNNAIRRIDGHTGVISTIAGRIPTSPEHCC